jgi:hypothetical protein
MHHANDYYTVHRDRHVQPEVKTTSARGQNRRRRRTHGCASLVCASRPDLVVQSEKNEQAAESADWRLALAGRLRDAQERNSRKRRGLRC